jgi:hypothetical protein
VHTAGDGTLTDGSSDLNFYSMNLEAHGKFNTQLGLLDERTWVCAGQPTASSALAQGGNGLPYIQRGLIKRIGPKATVNVGVTGEVMPAGKEPGLIGNWGTIGAPAGEIQP